MVNISLEDDEILGHVIDSCVKLGWSYDQPIEMRGYVNGILSKYEGEKRGFRKWLDAEVQKRFLSFKSKPKWLQNPEWPLGKEGPMVFVGQIYVPRGEVYAGVLQNHDATYYVFLDRSTGATKVVVQAR